MNLHRTIMVPVLQNRCGQPSSYPRSGDQGCVIELGRDLANCSLGARQPRE